MRTKASRASAARRVVPKESRAAGALPAAGTQGAQTVRIAQCTCATAAAIARSRRSSSPRASAAQTGVTCMNTMHISRFILEYTFAFVL